MNETIATTYVVQYRWPGTDWELVNHSQADYTLDGARDKMATMIEREITARPIFFADYPMDDVRMEYRIVRVTYTLVD